MKILDHCPTTTEIERLPTREDTVPKFHQLSWQALREMGYM